MDPAGHALAIAGATLGARVGLVTQGESSSQFAWRDGEVLRRAAAILSQPGFSQQDFRALIARLENDIDRARGLARLRAFGIEVFESVAQFAGNQRLDIGSATIQSRYFVLATGRKGASAEPGPASLFLEPSLPLAVDILSEHPGDPSGASGEAASLAQILARLGTRTRLLTPGGFLADLDAEATAFLAAKLTQDGVTIAPETSLPDRGMALIDLSTRPAWIGSLAPENAGITIHAGEIARDGNFRTSNRKVFVIGSASAKGGEVPDSSAQVAFLLARMLFRSGIRHAMPSSPRLVRTQPELAEIGLNEAQARAQNVQWHLLRQDFALDLAADGAASAPGMIKVLLSKRDAILGVTIVHARAGELIAPWSMAMAAKLPLSSLANWPLPSLVPSQASRFLARAPARKRLFSPFARRLVRFFRLFG